MSVQIPETHKDLLTNPIVATFVTLMPDNQPQATAVWFKYDGEHIVINTARGRQKDTNVQHSPKVTVMIIDPENPYRYLELRGNVAEVTEEGGMETIDELAKMYTGNDKYYGGVAPAEDADKVTRINIKVDPNHVNAWG